MNVHDYLKNARVKSKLTQRDVAALLGYTTAQFISNWENGKALPPVRCLVRLAEAYNIPRKTLLMKILEYKMAQMSEIDQNI